MRHEVIGVRKMKVFYRAICREVCPCLLELIVLTGIYYLMIHNTHLGSRPGMNVIIPATYLCIAIANIILTIKTDVLVEYLGKWAMITFVFVFILTGAVLFGCAPQASMRLIFVLSSTFGLVVVGYNKLFKDIFKKDTEGGEEVEDERA